MDDRQRDGRHARREPEGPAARDLGGYDVLPEPAWLSTEVRLAYDADKLATIARMDDPTNMDELASIGNVAAAKQVGPDHFPGRFDVA